VRVIAVLLVLLVGCGGAQRPPDSGDGPSCADVAAQLLALANRDNDGEAEPELAAGIYGEFERQCLDDRWSARRRTCLMASTTQEDTLRCPER
jgi:hypothetical protein